MDEEMQGSNLDKISYPDKLKNHITRDQVV